MKQIGRIFVIAAVLVLSEAARNSNEKNRNCPNGASYQNETFVRCEFTCYRNGVDFKCDNRIEGGGCNCDFDKYWNTKTQECTEVKCPNMDCVGKTNEAYFTCESGSRNHCGCESLVTLDCNTGCMCKNGYCRKNNECVRRDCPPGSNSPFN